MKQVVCTMHVEELFSVGPIALHRVTGLASPFFILRVWRWVWTFE